jgi:hypothetical protein
MLLKIDELTRADHSFLIPEDHCFYIREYTTAGYDASPDNQLVFNLKCPISHPNAGRLYYKGLAIQQAAMDISKALNDIPVADTVFIPLPPSKLAQTPGYDPRVRDMLRRAEATAGINVVEALGIRAERAAAHETEDRPTVDELVANFVINSLSWVGTKTVAIFDDVLVTGAQFRAAARVLRTYAPKANIVGLFWVRRTFP